MLPIGVGLEEHCGRGLTYVGCGVRWEGEHELTEARYRCDGCGLIVTVQARQHVGPVRPRAMSTADLDMRDRHG